MADRTESSIVVDAAPGDVLDVIADFDAYPEWTGAVRRPTVVEEYEDGWARQVRFTLDAGALKDTYTLAYEWDVDENGTGTVVVDPRRGDASSRRWTARTGCAATTGRHRGDVHARRST